MQKLKLKIETLICFNNCFLKFNDITFLLFVPEVPPPVRSVPADWIELKCVFFHFKLAV